MCPCSGLIASLGTPSSFLTSSHSQPHFVPARHIRHNRAPFDTIPSHSKPHSLLPDSTPSPLFPPRLSCRMPSHCIVLPPCNLPHTFRQHPGRRILPHSTPFPLTKTGDTEQSYLVDLTKEIGPNRGISGQPAIHNTEPFSPIDSYERLHPATPSCKKRFSRPLHKRKNLLKIHRSPSPGLREPQHRPPIIPPRTDYTHLTSAKSMRCGSLGFLA